MKRIRLATIGLLVGVFTSAAYGQSSGYGVAQNLPPNYDRGYDDRGYDPAQTPRSEVGFFYDELSPYGDWVLTPDYGWAWFPRDMHPYWRPYSDGRWVTTEYGWTWVSNEPFGWATYHYGRWAWDPRFGWLWVPGTIWGPAWVSWQDGGGYVGWAPLPPAVGFEIGIGIRLGGFDLNIGIRPDAYSFVPERSFLEARLARYVVPTARNVTIIHNTTNITNYTYIDNRVVNRGIDVRHIEQVTGQRVQARRVAAESRATTRSEVSANEVRIYRPDKQRLDSVRVGSRTDAGLRVETAPAGRERDRSPAQPVDSPAIVVAPRTARAPHPDVKQIEKQDRKEQIQLNQYSATEKQKLEKLHQQEISKARVQTDRNQVEKRQQAELEALQQEQRNAALQLAARQEAKRKAALASPPSRVTVQNEKKAADPKPTVKKGKAQPKNEKVKGQGEKPKPPASF
jgi:Family of unknown function (DUF6600)